MLQLWETTTAKRMKMDPYCQRQRYNPLNVFFNIICFLRWFTLALARLSCLIFASEDSAKSHIFNLDFAIVFCRYHWREMWVNKIISSQCKNTSPFSGSVDCTNSLIVFCLVRYSLARFRCCLVQLRDNDDDDGKCSFSPQFKPELCPQICSSRSTYIPCPSPTFDDEVCITPDS